MADVDQISFPVRIVGGTVATIDPDGDQFVAEQVEVLCLTPRGWFSELPKFGLADQKFRRGGADIGEIERQIQAWVPEADEAVEHDSTLLDRGLDRVGVQVAQA